jgi:hypothetical protein
MKNALTDAQEMWLDVITSVVQQPRFNIEIGDMSYVLGNMIAKFVSSAQHYRITEPALNHVTALGIDITKPVPIKKHVYGKDKPTLLEHMIPASIIKRGIVDSGKDSKSIRHILMNAGQVVIVLRTEDTQLIAAGLRSKMPPEWKGFGEDPLIRYRKAGIALSETLIVPAGPICR